MAQSNDSVLSLVKDIGLGLVQISGLLLTINLAVVVGALPEEARAEITGQVFASSVLLGVSIAIGLVPITAPLFSNESRSPVSSKAVNAVACWPVK